MSLWSRITNVFRGDRVSRDIAEEIQSHLAEAADRGRDPSEIRRAFGSPLRHRERSRDLHLIPWLDSLRADAVFGWRQLWKRKVTSAAAILSLALAIGSCTSAFRLIDALLLRPLPIANADRLYDLDKHGIAPDGKPVTYDSWAYPSFKLMRAAVKDDAELIAISHADRADITYASDQEMEKANVQYVSGWMFPAFGLQPVIGRLFTEEDDRTPGAHPIAVISYDYWTARFQRDPAALGRTFRMGNNSYQIIGVAPEPFTGTEPGNVIGIFVPTMMSRAVTRDDNTWIRSLALVRPGVNIEPLRQKLAATSRAFEEERLKNVKGITRQNIDKFLDQKLVLEPAAAGASGLQTEYRSALLSLGVLVALVLLIACANVANLMTAQAAARAREMALRVSIGAGRARLMQLVLVESAWLAVLSATFGALFAWWSAPFVVSLINTKDNPARLILPADWRVLVFGLVLTFAVTLLFGLAPALRASSVKPASALKGGDTQGGIRSRHRLMNALIATQVVFCTVVLLVATVFAASFERLSRRPLGFSTDRLLALDNVASSPQSPIVWEQAAAQLRALPGIETVAISRWPLLRGDGSNAFISFMGAPPTDTLAYFLNVSPGFLDVMKIPLLDGRDFRPEDTDPGAAIVDETFVKTFCGGINPIGRTFEKTAGHQTYRIVGVMRPAPYRELQESPPPVAYIPYRSLDEKGEMYKKSSATFMVRTTGANPLAMASVLRRELSHARAELRVSNLRPQADLVLAQTIRERLLAMLALFFAGVALVLATLGLYGVLDYSVVQRRREIGIRMAIGARAGDIVRRVTAEAFAVVVGGAVVGLMAGIGAIRYVETLLYQVRSNELDIMVIPAVAVLVATLLAAVPPAIRAVRIDPVTTLRSE